MTQSAYTGQRLTRIRAGTAAGFSVPIYYKQSQSLIQQAIARLNERAAARVKIVKGEA